MEAIPSFAVIGHPNEGKSSVVSTLTEDDSVGISPYPGETVRCRTFPVIIDGKEIIRFIDTPGFQNPSEILKWFQANKHQASEVIVEDFIKAHKGISRFKEDIELFTPLKEGAGIIYVVDGSRPLRKNDEKEMEILRLTGRPRIAIINSKEASEQYVDQWRNACRQNFSTREFNAHNAKFIDRIHLLESLKGIDQKWQPILEKVIKIITLEWENRNKDTAEIITDFLEQAILFKVEGTLNNKSSTELERISYEEKYTDKIEEMEKKVLQRIKNTYRHRKAEFNLPKNSVINKDLFHKETWEVLGLSRLQLSLTAAAVGATIGAGIDIAAAGITFGVFSATLGVLGGGGAFFGGENMIPKKTSKRKMFFKFGGNKIGSYKLVLGPNKNPQFMYIILDRVLLYYYYAVNTAHGKRGFVKTEKQTDIDPKKTEGFTKSWTKEKKEVYNHFFEKLFKSSPEEKENAKRKVIDLLQKELTDLCSTN